MSTYSIVIVDDEEIVTANLKILLKLEGYNDPVVFNRPQEAVDYLENNRVDLIISDFFMPNINGIELLKQANESNPGATKILLTGYADKESAIRAINEIGLYRYIEKPWDNDDLLLCIRNGLERSHLIENLEEKVRERTLDFRKANHKLTTIINYCADGIVTVAKDGRIVQSNPAFSMISGVDETLDKNISDICMNINNVPIYTRLDPENDILIRDYKIFNPISGHEIPVEISFAPVLANAEQGPNFFVGVIRDITPQQEAERLRDDFMATLTHDLRTPLLAAIQTLQFFVDGTVGELNDRQRKLLETMMHSNQDMLGLVNALLEVYRYESGELFLTKESFKISDMVHQCINEVQSLAESKELALGFEGESEEKVFADKQELRRVLANFLGNAIKNTNKGGKINVSVDFAEENVTVSVEDTGIGIPEKDMPKLFHRFSQGTGKKRSTSTGLGLYLSYRIIEAHGGKIWAESEVNKGSVFSFKIPKEKAYEKVGEIK